MAVTDGLDGYIARIWKQETKEGKFLDPLADKLVIAAALISLVELRELPAWIVIIIIAREFIVSGLRGLAISWGKDLPASFLGKIKTFSQVLAVLFWIIKVQNTVPLVNIIAWGSILLALILTAYSGFDYVIHFRERMI
jgi:CDP-diacylglycerol--glycerol-3-phosphate 3-phosphatidyltransferase